MVYLGYGCSFLRPFTWEVQRVDSDLPQRSYVTTPSAHSQAVLFRPLLSECSQGHPLCCQLPLQPVLGVQLGSQKVISSPRMGPHGLVLLGGTKAFFSLQKKHPNLKKDE